MTATTDTPVQQFARWLYDSYGLQPLRLPRMRKSAPPEKWQHTQHVDAEAVAAYFAGHDGNLATTFPPSIVVLDLDRKDGKDGVAALDKLSAKLGVVMPPTLTARTPNNGEHRFYRLPAGFVLKNHTGELDDEYPGLDVKTAGGYVVSEPSVIPEGAYSFDRGVLKLAELPIPVVQGLLDRERATKPKFVNDGEERRILAGGRDNTLASMAGSMRHVGFGVEAIRAALHVANDKQCDPPLDESDVERIAASIGKYAPAPGPEVFGGPLPEGALVRDAPLGATDRFKILSAAEVAALPRLEYIVDGVMPESGIGGVFGASGSGKSFLVTDLLVAMDEGTEWFGHKVLRPVPSLYIGLEGQAGASKRVAALIANGRQCSNVKFLLTSLNIRDAAERAQLIESIKDQKLPFGCIVVDTLSRSAPGADENGPVDMSEIIVGLTKVQEAIGGTVLVVHHVGKDATRGMRGHSSLKAALDFSIETLRDDAGNRSWRVDKNKDEGDGAAHAFALRIVDVGGDATSCVIEQVDGAAVVFDREATRTAEADLVFHHIVAAFGAGTPVPAATAGPRTCAHVLMARVGFPSTIGALRVKEIVEQLRQVGRVVEGEEKYGRGNSRRVLRGALK